MSDLLLVLWVMLIGADRIDLAGGAAPFVLIPFLALTPLVAAVELIRRTLHHQRIHPSRRALGYAVVAGTLVGIALVSVFTAHVFSTSASRVGLLVADVGLTFVIALLCVDRERVGPVLARGAIACLVLFVIFDVAEAFSWIGWLPETVRVGPVRITIGQLQNIGPLPRLGGPVFDANRAGFVLLFYALLIATSERRAWLRRASLGLIVIFLIATFSRSAILGAVAAVIVAVVTGRVRIPVGGMVSAGVVLAAAAAFTLARPDLVSRASAVITSPVLDRLSTNEGSAQGHLALIERGLTSATASIPEAAIGLGYGNSYLVLQDVFPGNRYGNFHSLYVSIFAEAGVFALVAVLILVLAPLGWSTSWRPLVAAAVVFNVFYQTNTEPAFWFTLAAAWLAVPLGRSRAVSASVGRGTPGASSLRS